MMSLLASLLYDRPLPVPPRPRQVIAPEMVDAEPHRACYERAGYGAVQPHVLGYLKPGTVATPGEIAKALSLNQDSVRRALLAMQKKGQVLQVCAADNMRHAPAMWRATPPNTGKEDQ